MDTPTTARSSTSPAGGDYEPSLCAAQRSRGWLFAMMVAAPVVSLLLLWAPVVRANGCTNVVVTTTADAGAGSLRQAMYEVCAGGKITFAPELTAGGPVTITLTGGQLTLPRLKMAIEGPGAELLAVSGNNAHRVFFVAQGVVAEISGLAIRDGVSFVRANGDSSSLSEPNSAFSEAPATGKSADGGSDSSGAGFLSRTASGVSQEVGTSGGGLYNEGHLTIRNSVIVSNAAGYGGGIYNSGALTVERTTLMRNLGGYGGGIQNDGYRGKGANLNMVDSVVMDNLADTGSGIDNFAATAYVKSTTIISNGICQKWNCGTYGGGVSNGGGSFTLADSVVRGNAIADGYGAGIFSSGALILTNTIVDRNGVWQGAGIAISNGTATIEHSLISNNHTDFNGGGITIGFWGQNPSLEISNSTITGNDAGTGMGGGIMAYESADVTIRRTTVVSNTAVIGGGIYNDGAITVVKSTIVSNTAFIGGGIYNDGAFTVIESTAHGNTAHSYGGGIANDTGAMTLENSTVHGNSARVIGGGISNEGWKSYTGTMTLTQVTVSENFTGGIWNDGGVLNLRNTIVANSVNRADYEAGIEGVIGVNVGNLVADRSIRSALSGDPLLGELGNYGGTTWTLPLLPGSPALGAGDTSGCLPADQRGVARSPAHCDIGAFESQGFTVTIVSGDSQKTNIGASFPTPLAVAVGSHDWAGQVEPVEGGAIIFQSPSAPAAGLSAAPVVTATVVGAQAALIAAANLVPGNYVVTGTAQSENMPVFFHLENLLSPFDAPAQISMPVLGK